MVVLLLVVITQPARVHIFKRTRHWEWANCPEDTATSRGADRQVAKMACMWRQLRIAPCTCMLLVTLTQAELTNARGNFEWGVDINRSLVFVMTERLRISSFWFFRFLHFIFRSCCCCAFTSASCVSNHFSAFAFVTCKSKINYMNERTIISTYINIEPVIFLEVA